MQCCASVLRTSTSDVKGNNELLSLTRPDVIRDIHADYLAAGADLIETNTFGATTIAQADYDMADLAREMNLASARLARAGLRPVLDARPAPLRRRRPRPHAQDRQHQPGRERPGRAQRDLRGAARRLLRAGRGAGRGRRDVLLVETIFDTLNAKAALFAIDEYFEASGERLPIIISGTVTDASGRILSGQTVDRLLAQCAPRPTAGRSA
jgi:5-methyltetrahydrofolate--homocysteine methyltransferase